MSDPYRKYAGLAYRELRARLHREGLPDSQIDMILQDIRTQRSHKTTAKKRQQQVDKQWREVIASLQHERRIVRSMVRYKTKTPAPERDEFVAQYFDVLNKLYDKLTNKKVLDKELPAHSHWTDYVPDKIRQAFIHAAGDVPPRDKAKFKEPFQRTDPLVLADLRRGRLLRYTRATLDAVITKQDVNGDDERAARKEMLLREAIKRINDTPENDHLPNHWADMVRDVMYENDDGEMVTVIKAKPPKKRGVLKPAPAPDKLPELHGNRRQEEVRLNALMHRQPLKVTLAKLIAGDTPRITED